MKKIWFPAVLTAALIVLTVAYIRLVVVLSQQRPVHDALPESAAVVLEIKNPVVSLGRLRDAAFSEYLGEAPFFKKMNRQLAVLEDFLRIAANDTAFLAWHDATLLANMSITGRDEYDYLYVFKKKNFTGKHFEKLMDASAGRLTFGKRAFRDETIYELTLPNAEKGFACAFVNGMLLASHTAFLVEESIVQLRDKTSILENKSFSEVHDLAGEDADVILYLNFPKLGAFETMLVSEERSDLFKDFTRLGSWMEIDFKIKNNSFILNGYTGRGEGETFLSKFRSEPGSQSDFARALPYNTAMFFYYAVDDFRQYAAQRENLFTGDMENFGNWIGNEWCFALSEPLDARFEEDAFLIVRATDPEIAALSLAENARLAGDDLMLSEYKQFPIGQLTLNDELNRLFDHHFLKLKNPYYTVIDEYVVFAQSVSVIKSILAAYQDGQSLASDPDYMVFERNLTTASNFYFYFNTSRSVELLNRMLSNPLLTDMRKGNKNFVKFSPAALQFSFYQDIFFTNGYIQFSSDLQDHTNRLWQAKLEAMPYGMPVLVTNHYTGEKEILVQDELYNLYLLTKGGKILWKRQLDSHILGEVYLIDFYENTKLQYAFSTKGKIYIIDRKGENVASYPIRLPAEATNGLLLTDYEKKRDYRLFVACANGNIYGYYKSGKPLPGWSPQEKVGIVKHPMQYVYADKKDYLIAVNEAGEVFLFDRKGDRRSKPVQPGKSFATDYRLRATKDNFHLVNIDHERALFKVYRNGSFSSQKQEPLPESFFDFFYTDLNGDGSYEFVFVDSLSVKAFDEKYQEINSYAFADKIVQSFLLHKDGQKGIGFLSLSGKKIYFTDENCKPYPGFPLTACTPFIITDLFDTGRKVVIAGDCDGWVNAYQVK